MTPRKEMAPKKKVLFVCTHNASRSQMAEAFLADLYPDRFEARSAGTHPTVINPYVVRAMAEIGIDLSQARPKDVSGFLDEPLDYVVTLCDSAAETCPVFQGQGVRMHRVFANPAEFTGTDEEIMRQVREVRDDIGAWVEEHFSGLPSEGCER